MFTTGSKWFLGLGFFSLVLAAAYGWSTGGTGLGPVSAGYNGGVGDHLGYTMLLSLGLLGVFLGLVALAVRDANPSALAQLAGTDVAPPVAPPAHLAYWPVLGALGLTLVVLGLVVSNVLFIAAFILLIGVLVEWMVLTWSDRATGDPEANRIVRARLMGPYEVPLIGVLLAGGTVAALSRVFLTSSKEGAVWVATGIGAVVFLIGLVIATRPKLSANAVAGVLVVAALGVVTLGVLSASRGERYIEKHHTGTEHEEADPEGSEPATSEHEVEDGGSGVLEANIPAGTQRATTTTEAEG
jgi:hypothetical protein